MTLTCEYGLGTNETVLRVYNNGKNVGLQKISQRVDIPELLWQPGTIAAIVGADLNKENGAIFDNFGQMLFKNTLPAEDIKQIVIFMLADRERMSTHQFLRFNGSDWTTLSATGNMTLSTKGMWTKERTRQ